MLLIHAARERLLDILPPGGEAAEIGVAHGDFSAEILARAMPSRLHLIDPWLADPDPAYATDRANADQAEMDRRHAGVVARLAGPITAGQVLLHRATSLAVAAALPEGSLDWVYIDGLHSREAVAADLAAWRGKLKPGGLILGHDFANHHKATAQGFGVVEAVTEFLRRQELSMLALTIEAWPSYVIASDAGHPTALRFLADAIRHLPVAADIARPETRHYRQQIITYPDGQERVVQGWA